MLTVHHPFRPRPGLIQFSSRNLVEDKSVTSDTPAIALVPEAQISYSPDPACADKAEGSLQDLRQPDTDAAVAKAAACPHVGFCGLS